MKLFKDNLKFQKWILRNSKKYKDFSENILWHINRTIFSIDEWSLQWRIQEAMVIPSIKRGESYYITVCCTGLSSKGYIWRENETEGTLQPTEATQSLFPYGLIVVIN